MYWTFGSILATLLAPPSALALPAPKGGGGGGFVGSRVSSFGGGSYGGSSLTARVFTGLWGAVIVGMGSFHGGADGRHRSSEPPADCVVAKTLTAELKPVVDCFYTWERWYRDNFLYYVIRITPTGQEVSGWDEGILDNIEGQCGQGVISTFIAPNRLWHTEEDWGETRTVNGSVFHGLEMTVPMQGWHEGEDNVYCVTEAIKRASCGVDLWFNNGSCYRVPGTLRAPWTMSG